MQKGSLIIEGARQHNLKNINLEIPRNTLTVITGLSGSGKSSLAFDTIYAEGQRRYVESLAAYARQFLGLMNKPDVDRIEGLSPAISIDQKAGSRNPRPPWPLSRKFMTTCGCFTPGLGIPTAPSAASRFPSKRWIRLLTRCCPCPRAPGFRYWRPW